MNAVDSCISYSIAVYILVLATGCILNLLRKHFVLQLAGIAFFFTYFFFKCVLLLKRADGWSALQFFQSLLPVIAGISACLTSMLLGFWIFPYIRRRFKGS